ncbi:phage attachment protein [Vibrio astriarenae]|nr:phage attachment protein [Vibrio sp. C7]
MGDIDPTDPIEPPDGGFEPPPIGGDNPLPPVDINPPDEIPPQDGTDSAVLQAIQNQHRDMNSALNHISSDLNHGFADVNNNLRSINNTNNAIGQTIVDQMNQDYEIYQAQRDLTLQNTAATYNMASTISGSIDGQTDNLLDGLSNHGQSIVGAIDGLGESLEGVGGCTPNEENNYTCEGRTGMDSDLVWDITGDINTQVDSEYSSAFGSVVSGAQSYIDGGQTDEMKGVMDSAIGVLFGGLPNIGSCTPFSLPMPNGNEVSFGCEFSDKFKLIASWLIYIYTVWTLIDLMLNGINPAQRKES